MGLVICHRVSSLFLGAVGEFSGGGKLRSSTSLGLCLALGLQAGGVLGQFLGERKELGLARNVLLQDLGNVDTILGLVVLKNTAQSSLGGAEGRVEGVDVRLLVARVSLLLLAVTDLKLAGLVIEAVGARDELLVLALEGEPSLKIVLLRGSVVESTGNDGNDAVRKAKRLVELFRGVNHAIEVLP